MTSTAPHSKAIPETTLQRTLTSVLNELPVDAALAAVFHCDQGPLVSHAARGFTPRDIQAILRALSVPAIAAATPANEQEGRALRLRLITPGAKSLLAAPLMHRNRTYGFLVIGRKESATFAKKEKSLIEQASDEVTKALDRESLFDMSIVLSRPFVTHEQVPSPSTPTEMFPASASQLTPELQNKINAVLTETNQYVAYDRIWVCHYDPLAGNVEVLGMAGDLKSEQKDGKKDLKPGHRLALDSSASGWAVRHRKPRVDHDLASTQGRFLDHKYLFKDRFLSSLVVPFFVRGQVGGTITLGSKEAGRYQQTDARKLEPTIVKIADILQAPAPASTNQAPTIGPSSPPGIAAVPGPSEPVIRKQERQAAIGEFSMFLATEVREPLASILAQLEEVTGEGILDFDPQTRVESAMRDLIRIDAILNEILDF